MGLWASELDHGAMEEVGPVWCFTLSFTSRGRPGACVLLTWGTHGTGCTMGRRHAGGRQCDALGNVLLGLVLPYSLMAVASFSRITHHATKQKWFRNGLRSTTTTLRCWLGLLGIPRSQSNWASVGCAGQTNPIHGGPNSHLTGLKGSAAEDVGARYHSTPSWV